MKNGYPWPLICVALSEGVGVSTEVPCLLKIKRYLDVGVYLTSTQLLTTLLVYTYWISV